MTTTKAKALFTKIDGSIVDALAATAARTNQTQRKIIESALTEKLLELSKGDALKEADSRYEEEIARLAASCNELITMSNKLDSQRKGL